MYGVKTRNVDELVKALRVTGISKSEVSRICAELDEHIERLRNRPLEGEQHIESGPALTAPLMS